MSKREISGTEILGCVEDMNSEIFNGDYTVKFVVNGQEVNYIDDIKIVVEPILEDEDIEIEIIELDEEAIYGDAKPYSEEGVAIFKEWCRTNKVTYYSAKKDSFSKIEAYKLAKKEGNTKLILEEF